MEDKVVLVEVETMNKVLALLGSMPYNQVAELVNEIQQNTSVVDRPEADAE